MTRITPKTAIATIFALLATASIVKAAAFADVVHLGEAASVKAHQLRTSGDVKSEELATTLGSLSSTYKVRTLRGKGTFVVFKLRRPQVNKSCLLEIQELHDRRPDAYGYTVLVNGKEVYFRTYQEMGAGPNHYFVNLPLDILGDDETIEVTLRSDGGAPFSLGRVWIYGDFFSGLAVEEGVYRTMGLNWPETQDFSEAKWGMDFKSYGPIGFRDVGGVLFANSGFESSKQSIDRAIGNSRRSGLAVQISFSSTGWGGSPGGPDGKGGDFGTDVQYSQRLVNPVTGRGNPTWPNLWSNSPWPTMANSTMNAVGRTKFRRAASYLAERLAFLGISGELTGSPVIIREHGLDYWTFGDFNFDYIEAAKADGVILDPTDGFDNREKVWMFNNITNIFGWMDKDMVAAFGWNPVNVDKGKVVLPTEQLVENMYAHTMAGTIYPLNDPRWLGWQTGVQQYMHAAGEFNHVPVWFDYIRAQGKLAHVNCERTVLKRKQDFQDELSKNYEAGTQFLTLFQYEKGDEQLVQAADAMGENPCSPVLTHEPSCLSLDFKWANTPGTPEQIARIDNLQVRQTGCGHHTNKLSVIDTTKPGTITYRLTNVGEPFTSDLSLTLSGRISKGAANRIEVAAGAGLGTMKPVKILTNADLPDSQNWSPHQTTSTTIDLGDGAKGCTEYFLRFTIHSGQAFDAAFLHAIKVGMTWGDRKSGQLEGPSFSKKQIRTLNLWVQDRAMAARLLEHYRDRGLEDAVWKKAKDLFDTGYYRSAHATLVGEISQLLPARYAVRGHGCLGRYPVEVTLDDPESRIVVDLLEARKDVYCWELKTEDEQRCTMTIGGLTPGHFYALHEDEGRHFRLAPAPGDVAKPLVADANGAIAMELAVRPARKLIPDLPRQLSGRYVAGNHQSIRIMLHDLRLTDYNGTIDLPVAARVKVSRDPDRLSDGAGHEGEGRWPQPNDRVDITFDNDGKVAEIKAFYGYDAGTIKSIKPATLDTEACNGIIELENGRRYELDRLVKADTVFLSADANNYELHALSAAFKPGRDIEVRYCPYGYKDRPLRMLSVKQPKEILLTADYTKSTGEEWKEQAVEVEGVNVKPRQPEPNYLRENWIACVLYPEQNFTTGYVTYKIERDKPFGDAAVEFVARAFEDSSRVGFLVSTDGKSWKHIGDFNNTWQSYIPLSFEDDRNWQYLDITDAVAGKNSFYLKVELFNHADDLRYCLAKLRVAAAP